MIESIKIAEWLSRLIQIPSVNPAHIGSTPEYSGEGTLAEKVGQWFHQFGGEVHHDEILPNRPNIYAIWRGESDRWLAIDVHVDTVGVDQMEGDPFSGEVSTERVFGRGAVDTKASLAVVCALLEAADFGKQPPKQNILIAATVDEEGSALGEPAFANWVRSKQIDIDELVVAEPTMCVPVYGHKGVVCLELIVRGKSSHSSQPELGKNAIAAAAHIVCALEKEQNNLFSKPSDDPLGTPSLTVSLIHGGSGANVVPDLCQITVHGRVVAYEKASEVANRIYSLAQNICPLIVELNVLLTIDAFIRPTNTPFIKNLVTWTGNEPSIVPYGTNAWAYSDIAKECVVLGPGSINQAHSEEEWVAISELEKLAELYTHWWRIHK